MKSSSPYTVILRSGLLLLSVLLLSGMSSCGQLQPQRKAATATPKPRDYSVESLQNMNTMSVKITLQDRLFKATEERSLRTQFQRIVQGKGYLLCQGDSFCVPEGTLSIVIEHDPRVAMKEWYQPSHLVVSIVIFDQRSREPLYQKAVGIKWAGSMKDTFSAILTRVDKEIPEKTDTTPTLIAPL